MTDGEEGKFTVRYGEAGSESTLVLRAESCSVELLNKAGARRLTAESGGTTVASVTVGPGAVLAWTRGR
jgi:hypothetical protein